MRAFLPAEGFALVTSKITPLASHHNNYSNNNEKGRNLVRIAKVRPQSRSEQMLSGNSAQEASGTFSS